MKRSAIHDNLWQVQAEQFISFEIGKANVLMIGWLS